ncbi:MFS transporter [Brachybacterium conglomeratum]|uniref:MFS transporter n=1 Tax=Brachybacterium conglomeratum TaxID=47846 RepID=UPI003DA156DA
MSTTIEPTPSTHARPVRRGSFAKTLVGSGVEMFDWTIYSTFASFFATSFFGADLQLAYLNSLIVFAVGFIARPLGSLLFGRISDTRGRRASLLGTSLFALVGTLMIALSPTHGMIGVGAVIVLITARVIQGLAHGGEQPAAGAYVSEQAAPERRGAASSLIYVAFMAGTLLGTLIGAGLSSVVGEQALTEWAWRIPFVVAGVLSLVALVLVHQVSETEVFTAAREEMRERPRILREMVRAWRPTLQIILVTFGVTIAIQNWAAMSGYHIAVFGSSATQTLWTAVFANAVAIPLLPLWGRLSDRIGRRPVMIIGLGGVALTCYPFMEFLDGSWQHMALTMTISQALLMGPLAILPALMAELVPTSIRTIGVGFGYALATAVFGGTVPALQAWIGGTWGPQYFALYVTAAAVVSIVVLLATVPETRAKDLHAEATTADLAR